MMVVPDAMARRLHGQLSPDEFFAAVIPMTQTFHDFAVHYGADEIDAPGPGWVGLNARLHMMIERTRMQAPMNLLFIQS
jgi:hypothetical protein